MVAAPETQQQQQQEAPATGHAHVQGLKSSFSKENVGKESENEEKGSVNGLTVVDGSDQSSSGATHNLPPPEVARNIPCRFFPLGTCKYGEQCIFSHGIPGVAGSPGVPPSPSVQPQVAPGQGETSQSPRQVQPHFAQNSVQQHQFQPHQHHHEHQQMMEHQQVVPSMEQAYMQGMPLYYPEQALQYGFQPPFSPEQAYYHFAPPPFQAYPQHYQQFAPHAYYPPPPPSSVPHLSAAAPAQNVVPTFPAEVSPSAPSQVPSPSQPSQSPSSSPVETATSPVPQEIPQGYAPTGEAESNEQNVDPSSPSQDSAPEGSSLSRAPASLHTFFQTSSPMPPSGSGSSTMTTVPLPAQIGSSPNPLPPAAISNSPNGFVKPLPARLAGPRRSIGGVPTGPYSQAPGMNGGKRRSFGGTRPPCSFFEANRCKNGDECSFVHLLQDGTDARALGRGMIGSDGRTDSPEATGGMPPAWLMNQKALRFAGANGAGGNGGNGGNSAGAGAGAGGGGKKQLEGGAIMNGGYSYRERGNGPVQSNVQAGSRGRYEEDQQARYATRQQFQPQVQMMEGQAQNHFSQALPQQQQQPQGAYHRGPFVNGSLAGRIPPGGTPQLVAAINGLTRRIPPAQTTQPGASLPQDASECESTTETPSTAAQGSAPASREASQQRVPTVNDFPALGSPAAPLSPNVEKDSYTNAVETPVVVKKEDEKKPEEETKKEVASSPVEESDGFVMVSHQDATPSSPSIPPTTSSPLPPTSDLAKTPSPRVTPVPASSAPDPQTSTAPPARPAQPPKLMVSFASIAKAASGPNVEKPKPKSTPSTPIQPLNKPTEQSKPSNDSTKSEKKDSRSEEDGKNDDGFVMKTSKKSKKLAARTPSTATQVPIKA